MIPSPAHRMRPPGRLVLMLALSVCLVTRPAPAQDAHRLDRVGSAGRGVVLYGGHFSPPHCTHVAEAVAALLAVGARQVLFIPSAPHAVQHEGARSGPGWHDVSPHRRVAMTWLATRGHPGLSVSCIEAGRTWPRYSSSQTVLDLAARLEGPVWLLMGSDVLDRLHQWEHFKEILRTVDLIVTEYPPRRLGPLASHLPATIASRYHEVAPDAWLGPGGRRILLRRFATGAVSSGQVRRAIEEGRPIEHLVGPLVARYIARFRLYRTPGNLRAVSSVDRGGGREKMLPLDVPTGPGQRSRPCGARQLPGPP